MTKVLEDDDLFEAGLPMPREGVPIDPNALAPPKKREVNNVVPLRAEPDNDQGGSAPTERTRARETTEAWKEGLITDDKGRRKASIANTMQVLSLHPSWDGVLAFNAFTESVEKLKAPPTREQDGAGTTGPWTDADTTRTVSWLGSVVRFDPSASSVDQVVAALAERRVVHPIRDYLSALQWDGVERLTKVLEGYFGTEGTAYTRAIGPRYLISAVARVMEPGCQADCCLILESPQQGLFKSTGLEALFGKKYFADTGLNIGDKDSYQVLRGKWCYELAELDSLKGKAETRIKNYVGARKDTYRDSYTKRPRDFLRQLVFCGTTNEEHYFQDKTGNRRFWPVRVHRPVAIDRVRADRDQLWAEAFHRYHAGEAWHVDTTELRKLCEAEQRAREIEDPWLPTVRAWLQGRPQAVLEQDGVSTADVLVGSLKFDAKDIDHRHATRMGQVLRAAGMVPEQVRVERGRVRLYFPSQLAQPEGADGCDKEGK